MRPFIPSAGDARVLVTTTRKALADLGTSIEVNIFTEEEALTFLAQRTSRHDMDGARLVANELGRLPLGLAQAAAVISQQGLDYSTYLERLHRVPVGQMLTPAEAGQYPLGLAAAVLLSVDAVQEAPGAQVGTALMEALSVLAPEVPRTLLHIAGQAGYLHADGRGPEIPPEQIDATLGHLAEWSLLVISVGDETVTVHRLVMRVLRERLAQQGRLAATCLAAAETLAQWAFERIPLGSAMPDRRAGKTAASQIVALHENAKPFLTERDGRLTSLLFLLRWIAAWFLNRIGDSATQAARIAEGLLADQEQLLGPDHFKTELTRSTLTLWGSRTRPPVVAWASMRPVRTR